MAVNAEHLTRWKTGDLGKRDVVQQNDAENTMQENGNKMDTLASDSKVTV